MPTSAQISEAKDCKAEELAKERYDKLTSEQLPGDFKPVTACDWAALAVAYVSDTDRETPRPDGGKVAFLHAVELNPAIAFIPPIWDRYFDQFRNGAAISAPTTTRKLRRALLSFDWGGGLTVYIYQIKYNLTITANDKDKEATVTGQLTTKRMEGTPDPDDELAKVRTDGRIQAKIDRKFFDGLSAALTDLLPVKEVPALVPCTDNYPNWQATLDYSDGTRITLTTKGGNLYFAGGPWFATINKQSYVQCGAHFVIAVGEIREALNLPYGTTGAMYCGGIDGELIDLFYTTKAKK